MDVSGLAQLEILDLSENRSVMNIMNLPRLESCQGTWTTVKQISNCPQLITLDLSIHSGPSHISNCPKLQELDISESSCSKDSELVLKDLPSLTSLNCSRASITRDISFLISSLKADVSYSPNSPYDTLAKLRVMRCAGCKLIWNVSGLSLLGELDISEKCGVREVVDLPNLRTLYCCNNKTMKGISRLPRLEKLDIRGTNAVQLFDLPEFLQVDSGNVVFESLVDFSCDD